MDSLSPVSPCAEGAIGDILVAEILRDVPRVNKWFTFACFAAPPAAGSLVSILYNGGALYCGYEMLRGRTSFPRDRPVIVMTMLLWAYCLAMLLSALINPEISRSLPRLVGLASLALFPISYAYWRNASKQDLVVAAVFGAAIASATGGALGLFQMALGFVPRAEGATGNPLVFGAVIALSVSITFAGALALGPRHRPLLFAAALLGAAGAVLSGSRSAMIVIAINLVLISVIWVGPSRIAAMWVRRPVLAPVITFALFALSLFALLSSGMIERFGLIGDEWRAAMAGNYQSSIGVRVALSQIAVDMWRDAPWLGHGAGIIEEAIQGRLRGEFGLPDTNYSHFHNFALQSMVEGGLLGFVTMSALIVYPLYLAANTLARDNDREVRFGGLLLLILAMTYLISGATNLMLRHDILDAVFLTCLVPGIYLATGKDAGSAGGGASNRVLAG